MQLNAIAKSDLGHAGQPKWVVRQGDPCLVEEATNLPQGGWFITNQQGDSIHTTDIRDFSLFSENERQLRQRRAEILIAGNGDQGMNEQEAMRIAFTEPVEDILNVDGEHIAETDPDLFDEGGNFLP